MRHESFQRAAIVLLIPLLAALACAPLLRAGFNAEDFGWLALARHLDEPQALLHSDVAFAYFYRPVGLLFWRWCTVLGGTDAWVHNLLDLLLQALNAGLVACLAARLSRSRAAGIVAGVVFACLPPTSGTALWMSDRFDPVALCFGLLALLALDRAVQRPRAWPWVVLCLLLCLNAKEIGYAIAAAMLALLAWHALIRREMRPWLFAAVLLPIVAALALHALIVVSVDAALNSTNSVLAFERGVGYWWARLADAVFGFRDPGRWAWILLGVAALVALAGIATAIRQRRHDIERLALVGATLMVVPAFLQWPVTQLILGHVGALAFINLRFYYTACAGVALLWAAGYAGLQATRARWLLPAATAALALQGFAIAHQTAHEWAHDTRAFSARYLAIGQDLGARSFSHGCRIHLQAAGFPVDFSHYGDVIVKGAAPRGADVLDCAIFVDEAPYMSIVGVDLCTDAQWPGLSVRSVRGRRLLLPIGNLCQLSFEAPHFTPGEPGLYRFEVDASGKVTPLTP